MKVQNSYRFVKQSHCKYFVCVCLLLASCQSGKIRSVTFGDGIRAEGKISADTIYDGIIKFYDTKTGKLIEKANYVNGTQSGADIVYNENGTIAFKTEFADNKQNGFFYHFDRDGKLAEKGFSYFGINVGGNVKYLNDSVKEYYFYDFDENVLLDIDYDSIRGKQFGKTHPILFFFRDSYYRTYDDRGRADSGKNYFIYTPTPPKFDFKYSFVEIDSSFKVLSVLKEVGNNQPWSIVHIDWQPDHPNQQLAVRLKIRDSINNVNMTAFKIIKF